MSVCDRTGAQLHPDDWSHAEAAMLDDMGAILEVILRDTRHDMEERVRLVTSLLDMAELAGLRDVT